MKTMRKLAVIVLSAVVLATGFVGVASAQGKPFSSATNYMSQAGYTRYLHYLQTGQWTLVAKAGE